MNLFRSLFPSLIFGIAFCFAPPCSGNPAARTPAPPAQAPKTLDELACQSLELMKRHEWEPALKLLTEFTERVARRDRISFPAHFGVIWYRKGCCELKLGRYDDAMRSFAICYRDYPNRTPKVRAAGNIYHKRALLRWGDAARGAGDYAAAARLYKKFLAERDPRRDKVSMPDIYSKLSICYSKIGKIPEAAKSLEIALKARRAYRFAKLRGVRQRL